MVETVQKQKQERIRGPAIEVFRKYKEGEGVSFPDALKLVDDANMVLVSNKRHDKALVGSDEWKGIKEVYPCWTGTIIGYEERRDKKLGKEIVYTDPKTRQRYIFPTGDAKGSKNVILVAEHPDYELVKDGKDLRVIVKESMVDILEDFPVSSGRYKTDEKHGIPYGEEVSRDREDARCLWRIDKRIGPVARGYVLDYDDRLTIDLGYGPSYGFGVAVEAPKGSRPKKLQVQPEQKLQTKEEPKLRITKDQGKLIIEGTPEQLKEAERLLKFSFFP